MTIYAFALAVVTTAVTSQDSNIPPWSVPVASVVGAAIAGTALIIVRKVRGPVTVQDLWAENRQLRADVDIQGQQIQALMRAQNTQINVNQDIGFGFDAVLNYIDRTVAEPEFTVNERSAIDRARALREDQTLWQTFNPMLRENREDAKK